MRAIIVSLVALVALGGRAAAFDCDNPGNPAVAVVCSDPELIKLTKERQRVWKALHDRVQGDERRSLKENERHWLAHYPEACGVSGSEPPAKITDTMRACFKHADTERIAFLRSYGSGDAPTSAPAPSPAPTASPAPAPAAASAPAPSPGPAAAAAPDPLQPASLKAAAGPPPAPSPAKQVGGRAAAAGPYHLKFTFACQTQQKLSQVLGALERNDIGYALSQTDCLPVPAGREANLLSVAGNVAKVKLCSADAGCTEVYADASKVVDPAGQPVAK